MYHDDNVDICYIWIPELTTAILKEENVLQSILGVTSSTVPTSLRPNTSTFASAYGQRQNSQSSSTPNLNFLKMIDG